METEKTFSGETLSYWMQTDPFLPPQGQMDNVCEVCVVGAGIAGLTTAYNLSKEGSSVIVVDMGPVSGGQTGRTTSHLTWAIDDRFYRMIQYHGERKAALIGQSHREAIDKVEAIIAEELIDCEFTRLPGYLFLGPDQSVKELDREQEAIQKLGFQTVERKNSIPRLPFESGPCLQFPNQGQFHPIKYMNGLTQAIERYGGQVYIHQKVDQIEDGSPCLVTLEGGFQIKAQKVVVASNTPVNDRFTIHTKQAPYRTYVVAARIPKDSIPWALYWDTLDPYHYVRVTTDDSSEEYDLLIIGGEDHKTGQDPDPEKHFAILEDWARRHFPMIKGFPYHWSGQVWEPVDGVAFIGKNPGDRNTFIVTGDSGQGMTHGTIAGFLLADLIQGRSNPYIEIYDPNRKSFNSGLEFLKENLNVAWQYTDYMSLKGLPDSAAISNGEGAVLQRGLGKVAVYKSLDGQITEMSAVCPHLGCIVHWNSVEKSWDCPCHGSRFDKEGTVITGPALHALEKLEPASEKSAEKSPKGPTKKDGAKTGDLPAKI